MDILIKKAHLICLQNAKKTFNSLLKVQVLAVYQEFFRENLLVAQLKTGGLFLPRNVSSVMMIELGYGQPLQYINNKVSFVSKLIHIVSLKYKTHHIAIFVNLDLIIIRDNA